MNVFPLSNAKNVAILRAVTIFVAGLCFAILCGCGVSNQDLCGDVQCPDNAVCINEQCVLDNNHINPCPEGCPPGQYCHGGQCLDELATCQQQGDDCDLNQPLNNGYICADWSGSGADVGQCSVACNQSICPRESTCYYYRLASSRECRVQADCTGAGEDCINGRCLLSICRPSECEGEILGDDFCQAEYSETPGYEWGARCQHVGNLAHFCVPTGKQQQGESCIDYSGTQGYGEPDQNCAPGLICRDSKCRTPCEDDTPCDDGATCIALSDNEADSVGFCATECTPFEDYQCGAGQRCQPITRERGFCTQTGNLELLEKCTLDEDQCKAGLQCFSYGESNSNAGRCYPICDLGIAPSADDGFVDENAAQLRDSTCPQPEPLPSYIEISHLAQGAGELDVYVTNDADIIVSAFRFGEQWPSNHSSDSFFKELPSGQYSVEIRPAQSPPTDAPIASTSFISRNGSYTFIAIAPPARFVVDELSVFAISTASPNHLGQRPGSNDSYLQWFHTLSDINSVDIVAHPVDTEWTNENLKTLAVDIAPGKASEVVSLTIGMYDIYLFSSGDAHEPTNILHRYDDVEFMAGESVQRVFLIGTLYPDDLHDATELFVAEWQGVESHVVEGMQWVCREGNDSIVGFCQQLCPGGVDGYFKNECAGDQMTCSPHYIASRQQWIHQCAPAASVEPQQECIPSLSGIDPCVEGYYCMPTGTGASGQQIGHCTALCATNSNDLDDLSCTDDQMCRPLASGHDFDLGQCAIPCVADEQYRDTVNCPENMQNCTPQFSLQYDYSGASQPIPWPQEEQSFCDISGTIAIGEQCRGGDCEAGSECLFERSVQEDLTASLLSPYFGTAGQSPVCRAYCDPFGTGRTEHQCPLGETCLFNYPFNADVGHCAPIDDPAEIDADCTSPGLACGEDAICTWLEGVPRCVQYCQYTGGTVQGNYHQSSCANDYQCVPLADNIGYCVQR